MEIDANLADAWHIRGAGRFGKRARMIPYDVRKQSEPFDVQPIGRVRSGPEGDGPSIFGYQGSLTLAARRGDTAPKIRVAINSGRTIWGRLDGDGTEGVQFDHRAFLEFFAANWGALWLEDLPANISLGSLGCDSRHPPDEDWIAFQARHCVSGLLSTSDELGIQPDWWLIASGSMLHVVAPDIDVYAAVSLGQGLSAIERCCDHIARWIVEEDGAGGADVVARWGSRRRNAAQIEDKRF